MNGRCTTDVEPPIGNLYLSGIFHVFGALLLLLCYRPLPARHELSYLARLKKLDFVGCLLFAIGWCLLWGLNNIFRYRLMSNTFMCLQIGRSYLGRQYASMVCVLWCWKVTGLTCANLQEICYAYNMFAGWRCLFRCICGSSGLLEERFVKILLYEYRFTNFVSSQTGFSIMLSLGTATLQWQPLLLR